MLILFNILPEAVNFLVSDGAPSVEKACEDFFDELCMEGNGTKAGSEGWIHCSLHAAQMDIKKWIEAGCKLVTKSRKTVKLFSPTIEKNDLKRICKVMNVNFSKPGLDINHNTRLSSTNDMIKQVSKLRRPIQRFIELEFK